MSNTDLKEYLPLCYEGILEAEAEQDALSVEINKFNQLCEQALNDQFIQNCSLKAIGYYETIFSIVADPVNESLEFRRERISSRMKSLRPPYTYWYLRKMLDGFFGVGNYDLEVDHDDYTITLESSSEDSSWYHEIQVSMTLIKPCNMIFVYKPRITNTVLVNETVKSQSSTRNYRLNGTWKLGLRPFVSAGLEEINKMPDVHSIQSYFIQQNLDYWETLFAKAVINNSITVTNLNITQESSDIIIQFEVSHEQTTSVTNIKLKDSQDITLTNSNVYIPVQDYVIIKHIIKLEEGVNG